jgi:molybdopterin-synthase adenylyltransferase
MAAGAMRRAGVAGSCAISHPSLERRMKRTSVAVSGAIDRALAEHLLRADGQEDLCFLTWKPSTGHDRTSALLESLIVPERGERHVHGNASFEAGYLMRAAQLAGQRGSGLALAHSHPGGRGWQLLSGPDRTAEARIANVARGLTGLPLLGLTLAGEGSWSGRFWEGQGLVVKPLACEAVRIIGESLRVSFNDQLLPRPAERAALIRTVNTWGERTQAMIARLRVAVVGAGSVGMIVAESLARTGVRHIGVFEFDSVEMRNLDRLRAAGVLDAILRRPKVELARRVLLEAATADTPVHELHTWSICEPEGFSQLLDYDIVFSCVDRPWPRHVLNALAYADLIPVIDGGLRAFKTPADTLRNAYWRSAVIRPGRPCLACLGQYEPGHVSLERDGSLDDPSYLATLPLNSPLRARQNVAAFSVSVAGSLLQQFIAYVAAPGGFGDPGPLRFDVRSQVGERENVACPKCCAYPASIGAGDTRLDPTGRHFAAERARAAQHAVGWRIRTGRIADDSWWRIRHALSRGAAAGMAG